MLRIDMLEEPDSEDDIIFRACNEFDEIQGKYVFNNSCRLDSLKDLTESINNITKAISSFISAFSEEMRK